MMYLVMIIVAFLAIGFAVWPLLREGKREEGQDRPPGEDPHILLRRQLQEIEFDYATGKLGEEEYQALRKGIRTSLSELQKSPKASETKPAALNASLSKRGRQG